MNRESSWVIAGYNNQRAAQLAGVILRLEGTMRRIREEPEVRLACGCAETMLGAIHKLGESEKGERVWYQNCVWHGEQKVIGKVKDERVKPGNRDTSQVPLF